MGIIVTLGLILMLGLFATYLFDKNIEEVIPFSTIFITVYLFIFYMLNILKIGYITLILLIIILFIFAMYKIIKNRKYRKIIKKIFTPGLIVLGICTICIYLFTRRNYVLVFDELRLWAAYPKCLYQFETLLLGNNSKFLSTTYFPGMPLFQYFVAKNSVTFNDNRLFFSYYFFALSFIIPFAKNISWKKWWKIIPTIIILLFFPMLFSNSGFDNLYYYLSLFIDPILGISFGYALYISTKDIKKDNFNLVMLCLSLASVILFKIVGLVLDLIVLLSLICNQLFVYKNIRFKKSNIKYFVKLLMPFLTVILVFFSWQLCIKNNSNEKVTQANSISISSAIKLFFTPNEEDVNFMKEYIQYIRDESIIITGETKCIRFTVPRLTIVLLVIALLFTLSIKKENKKGIVIMTIISLIGLAIYLYFYYIIYTYTFDRTITCYGRYISSFIGGISIFWLLYINSKNDLVTNNNLYMLTIIIAIFLSYIKIYDIKYDASPYFEGVYNNTNEIVSKFLNSTELYSDTVKNVLTVYNSCDSELYECILYQHELHLSLIENNYFVTQIVYAADLNSIKEFYSLEKNSYFANFLNGKKINLYSFLEDIDYVIIAQDIDLSTASTEYKKYFNNNYEKGKIFKVIKNNNDYKLININ